MKNLFNIITLFLISSFVSAEIIISNEYVSIDCPKGDITMYLNENGTFLLELKYWDKKTQKHTHSDKLSGKWLFKDNQLSLDGEKKLIYKRDITEMTLGEKSASIDSFMWVSSSTVTFADSYTLVERLKVDNLFTEAISK